MSKPVWKPEWTRVWLVVDPEEGSVVYIDPELAESDRKIYASSSGPPNAVIGPFVWEPTEDAKRQATVVRTNAGACGRAMPGFPSPVACLLPVGHDGGVHEGEKGVLEKIREILDLIDPYEVDSTYGAVKEIRALVGQKDASE